MTRNSTPGYPREYILNGKRIGTHWTQSKIAKACLGDAQAENSMIQSIFITWYKDKRSKTWKKS